MATHHVLTYTPLIASPEAKAKMRENHAKKVERQIRLATRDQPGYRVTEEELPDDVDGNLLVYRTLLVITSPAEPTP